MGVTEEEESSYTHIKHRYIQVETRQGDKKLKPSIKFMKKQQNAYPAL